MDCLAHFLCSIPTRFCVAGHPITSLCDAIQDQGYEMIACRTEQTASHCALFSAWFTCSPSLCLVTGGAGWLYCLPAYILAKRMQIPVVFVTVFHESHDQIPTERLFQQTTHLPDDSHSIRSMSDLPNLLEMRKVTVLALSTLFLERVKQQSFYQLKPLTWQIEKSISPLYSVLYNAVSFINSTKRPLLIVGDFSVHYQADIHSLIQSKQIPWLAESWARGLIPDTCPLNASSLRSFVLKNTDCIIFVGVVLDWRWMRKGKWIWSDSVKGGVFIDEKNENNFYLKGFQSVIGNVRNTINFLVTHLKTIEPYLIQKKSLKWVEQDFFSMETIFHGLNEFIPGLKPFSFPAAILISEGGVSLDSARKWFCHSAPLTRVDPGPTAAMGMAMGAFIAASLTKNSIHQWILCLVGDSALGFSSGAIDLETMQRYKLSGLFVIINNHGIYGGDSKVIGNVRNLLPSTRYEALGWMVGAESVYRVHDWNSLKTALNQIVTIGPQKLHILHCFLPPNNYSLPSVAHL